MKKIIIILMCLTMLCGCSDYAEINDMVIVSGIIIDYKDNMFTINTETIVNDKESRIETYETTSPSIQEGLSKISEMSNKKLFLPHLKSSHFFYSSTSGMKLDFRETSGDTTSLLP